MGDNHHPATEKTSRQKTGLPVVVTIVDRGTHGARKNVSAIGKIEPVLEQIRPPLTLIPFNDYFNAHCSYTL